MREKELEERIERLENEIKHLKKNNPDAETDSHDSEGPKGETEEVTRRSFLKKLGFGALGVGALSLSPSAALDVKHRNFNVFTGPSRNQATNYLSIEENGPVNIQNTDLNLNNQQINQVSELQVDQINGVDAINGQDPENIDNRYTDQEAVNAVNNDADHGSTATHNYFSGDHNDLSNIDSNDHHDRYTDSEASNAAPVQEVNGQTGDVNIDTGGRNIKYIARNINVSGGEGGTLATIEVDGGIIISGYMGFPEASNDGWDDHMISAELTFESGQTNEIKFENSNAVYASFNQTSTIEQISYDNSYVRGRPTGLNKSISEIVLTYFAQEGARGGTFEWEFAILQ
jgi:hypothetical protein